MPGTEALTSYKKQDGILSYDKAKRSVKWRATDSDASVIIPIADVTNLQQTPATSAKVALKIFVQPSGAEAPANHVFSFTSPGDARAEQESITNELRDAISAVRNQAIEAGSAAGGSIPTTAGGPGEDGRSAAMAFAQTVASGSKAAESWYDDQQLKSNVELQQSLLKKDPTLRQRFEQSLREKPEGITNSQFQSQFWGARIHLLRAHAIERSQSQGTYNVLAEVKPKTVDGATRLNLSKEQIQLIFEQHPIVKHVYNEVVPKLSEMEFWARFFVSRLFKKLKGERTMQDDATDPILDRYLTVSEESLRKQTVLQHAIPHFIDLEGNEQNHSQQQGNAPDFTMRPNATDKVPILRVLNNMSEKMMANVAQNDEQPHAPVGQLDDAAFNELRLRDLAFDAEDDRVVLNIKDQRRLFGTREEDDTEVEHPFARLDPSSTLKSLNRTLSSALDLPTSSEPSPKSEEDTMTATTYVQSLINQQRQFLFSSATSSLSHLPPDLRQSLTLTHTTTTEFLHYFWTVLLTRPISDPTKDLGPLMQTLVKSMQRIDSAAAEAEKAEQPPLKKAKLEANGKGKGRAEARAEPKNSVKEEIERLFGPTKQAIRIARTRYEELGGNVSAIKT